jgi:CheY-like chemotaxis protein/HPt (histidine-containing phosphotransfer) domain-containing protein
MPMPMDTARILVVDDNDLARDLTAAILAPAGYEVGTAANGAEAVEAVRRDRYDLVLLDLNMPVMDGLAASRAIRASEDEGRRLPLLALSARPEEDEGDARRAAGIDASLGKPFRAIDLLALVHRWTRPEPSAENETRVWDEKVYQELAGGIGARAMNDLLLLFGQHLDRALLVVETSAYAREAITREAHNLVSCAGMLGFEELARASRAMMMESGEWKGAAADLRLAIGRARDCLARRRRLS